MFTSTPVHAITGVFNIQVIIHNMNYIYTNNEYTIAWMPPADTHVEEIFFFSLFSLKMTFYTYFSISVHVCTKLTLIFFSSTSVPPNSFRR